MTGNSSLLLTVLLLLLAAAFFVVLFLLLKSVKRNKTLEETVAARTRDLALNSATANTIFESIPDLVFCKDLNLNFTRCNRSFEKHFGLTEESLIGKDDVTGLGMSGEAAEAFHEIDRMVISDGKTHTVEELIPAADGVERFFETKKTPILQDGAVIGIMGISRDISQRKADEETLKLTLDNLDTCIYINEIETGKILFINQKMSKEFGGVDYTGKICWEVLQKGFTEQCDFCPISKLMKSGNDYYVWEEHNTVTNRYYRNTDSLIRWADGKLVHMQHSVDITDWINLQRALEHASKAKSDFLSRMSHEIRTPLNAIIGMTGIAKNTNVLGKINHCLERVDNASKHLLGIINDILDMSKIEADKFELSPTEFDFEKLLMNIINIINFRAEEKKQNLVVDLKWGVPAFVIGDELRLSQVITNLLTNAVKFTPENGTVVLGIEKTDEVDGKAILRVEVADNGIGISQEQQKRLFSSFEQADDSISRKFGGTGLGLAISKRIVELMGGRMWVESELGQGSKFIFTIPVLAGKEKAQTELSARASNSNIRILAVDDSAETRDYFSYLMSANELACDVASDGYEALEMIKNNAGLPYNIFFVDWQMPGMDGIELTKRIKDVAGDNSVVIMISVADWNNIKEAALAAGVKRFISKPLFPSTLIDAINECLGARHIKESLPQGATSMKGMSFSGHTILIAEDVEVNREIMSAVLEETGIAIDFAENGALAVSMFGESPDKYSLIFMDIHMPEMDGYEATQAIRALDLPQARQVPIIAMTANVFREDIEKCLAVGMNDHLGKPIDQADMFTKLSVYLPKKKAPGQGAAQETARPTFSEFLPAVDVQGGLGRLRNNKKLYCKMLKDLGVKTMAEEVTKDISGGNIAKAAKDAHVLRGAALNLGLSEVAAAAARLESLKEPGGETQQLLEALNQAVAAADAAIARICAVWADEQQGSASPPQP